MNSTDARYCRVVLVLACACCVYCVALCDSHVRCIQHAPINHGPTGEGAELLRSAARVIGKFVALAEGDVRFNIMALAPKGDD